jgi:carnitine-CoA ligase
MTESLPGALATAALAWPDEPFLRIDGRTVSFAAFEDQVGRLAAGLAEAGLRPGDRLLVFMANSLECLHTWFAANRLGAVWAPVNTEFRGRALAHVCALADARVWVADAGLLGPLLDATQPPRLIVNGDGATPLAELYGGEPAAPAATRFSDPASLLFTSGTTGRSKACLLSHRYFISQASILIRDVGLRRDDVLYCPFPLFHADATALTTVPALLLGATAAISRRFSASRFWAEVRETGATVFDYMGATLSILHRAEPRPDDADNPVRVAWGVPLPEWAPEFERRFGLELVTLYGSVEANICVTQPAGRARVPGACGRAAPEFDVRIHDPQDRELPPGEAGEIVVRPREPSIMLDEYFGNPEATAAAFRNLWFHTGDVGSTDADGNLYFIGRANEAIRRRGENISAFEVEEGLLTHPDIVECAAIGVPSELTEEDVKVCIVRRAGSELQPDDVIAHAERELARFQVPRYVEFVDALPKTPTGKVAKHQLARDGRNPGAWDREMTPVTSSHNVD